MTLVIQICHMFAIHKHELPSSISLSGSLMGSKAKDSSTKLHILLTAMSQPFASGPHNSLGPLYFLVLSSSLIQNVVLNFLIKQTFRYSWEEIPGLNHPKLKYQVTCLVFILASLVIKGGRMSAVILETLLHYNWK